MATYDFLNLSPHQIKTNSIEQALQPLIRQISILIRAGEGSDIKADKLLVAMTKVSDNVALAVDKFVLIGETLAAENPHLASDLLAACEEVKSSGDSMRLATDPQQASANDNEADWLAVISASRRLLSAICTVLLLADRLVIDQIQVAIERVAATLLSLDNSNDLPTFIERFSDFGTHMVQLAHLTGDRQRDLRSIGDRCRLSAARATLEKATPLLLVSCKTSIRHPDAGSALLVRDATIVHVSRSLRLVKLVVSSSQALHGSQNQQQEQHKAGDGANVTRNKNGDVVSASSSADSGVHCSATNAAATSTAGPGGVACDNSSYAATGTATLWDELVGCNRPQASSAPNGSSSPQQPSSAACIRRLFDLLHIIRTSTSCDQPPQASPSSSSRGGGGVDVAAIQAVNRRVEICLRALSDRTDSFTDCAVTPHPFRQRLLSLLARIKHDMAVMVACVDEKTSLNDSGDPRRDFLQQDKPQDLSLKSPQNRRSSSSFDRLSRSLSAVGDSLLFFSKQLTDAAICAVRETVNCEDWARLTAEMRTAADSGDVIALTSYAARWQRSCDVVVEAVRLLYDVIPSYATLARAPDVIAQQRQANDGKSCKNDDGSVDRLSGSLDVPTQHSLAHIDVFEPLSVTTCYVSSWLRFVANQLPSACTTLVENPGSRLAGDAISALSAAFLDTVDQLSLLVRDVQQASCFHLTHGYSSSASDPDLVLQNLLPLHAMTLHSPGSANNPAVTSQYVFNDPLQAPQHHLPPQSPQSTPIKKHHLQPPRMHMTNDGTDTLPQQHADGQRQQHQPVYSSLPRPGKHGAQLREHQLQSSAFSPTGSGGGAGAPGSGGSPFSPKPAGQIGVPAAANALVTQHAVNLARMAEAIFKFVSALQGHTQAHLNGADDAASTATGAENSSSATALESLVLNVGPVKTVTHLFKQAEYLAQEAAQLQHILLMAANPNDPANANSISIQYVLFWTRQLTGLSAQLVATARQPVYGGKRDLLLKVDAIVDIVRRVMDAAQKAVMQIENNAAPAAMTGPAPSQQAMTSPPQMANHATSPRRHVPTS